MDRRVRGLPILAALAVAILLAVVTLRFIDMRTDLADFLPAGKTDAARFMVRELREGIAGSVILIGIEGAPSSDLARISSAMGAALEHSGLFAVVANGRQRIRGADEDYLFHHRYLLSPLTTPAAFTVPALRRDLQALLDELRSSASPLAERFGLADPGHAFLALGRAWIGTSPVRTIAGVWFAPNRDRALILARTRAGGMNVSAQDRAEAAINGAFASARPGPARLLVTGPAVFARDAAHQVRGDVERLSILSSVLSAALLFWRFRSPWVIAAIAVPVLLSLSAATFVVQLAFGFVHGIVLGFGMTMLGVTVDYPVLLIGHRKQGEAAAGTLRRIGRTLSLTVASAALGLTGMLFAGFPGLAQLGLFSMIGILTAAAATRWVLPRLIVAADLAPVSAGDPSRLLRVERLRRWRAWGLLPVGAAVLVLLTHGLRWEDDLSHLSPVPASALALDAELRGELGAPEAGPILVVRAPTEDAVLQREEALLPLLDRLQADHVIGGAELAARYLPSAETQMARRAALPAPDVLAARLAEAASGLPFRTGAFQPFVDAVAASRGMTPVRLADLTSPLIAARLQPLLFTRDGTWFGVIAPSSVADPVHFARAVAAQPGLIEVDMRTEGDAILTRGTRHAWRWLGFGALAALVALSAGLRDRRRVARVAGAVGAAGLLTLALLALLGVRLSLIHIVSLQFVAGIGLDYALFFARPQLDREERARTLRTLVTCNALTVLTFGLLALCRTPLLAQIGLTVTIGAIAAMVFAFLFAGEGLESLRERA